MIKKTPKLFFAVTLLYLAGCSNFNNDTGAQNGNSSVNTMISGMATKGRILSASVSVFAVVNHEISSEPMSINTTEENGLFNLSLGAGYSGPILVQINNNNDQAVMTCDAVKGCGDYHFGETMPLNDVVLEAFVANVTPGEVNTISINPLTHMAASKIREENAFSSLGIARINSAVGNLFGISNPVKSNPPDLANARAAMDENLESNDLKTAYFSAAIATIANDSCEADIRCTLDNLNDSYVENDGQLIQNEEIEHAEQISLSEITRAAAEIADELDYHQDIQLALEHMDTDSESPEHTDQPTHAESSPNAGKNDSEKAKAFIQDLRTWSRVIHNESNESVDQFRQEIETAGSMFDRNMFTGLMAIIHATEMAVINGNEGKIDVSEIIDNNVFPDASGWVKISDEKISIESTINQQKISLKLEHPEIDDNEIELSIAALKIVDEHFELSLKKGKISFEFDDDTDLEAVMADSNAAFYPNEIEIKINMGVTVTQTNVNNPVQFSGGIKLGIEIEGDSELAMIEEAELKLGVSGSFSNEYGDSFSAAQTITLEAENDSLESKFKFSIQATLEDLPKARFTFVAKNEDLEESEVDLEIAYGGRHIKVKYENEEKHERAAIKIENQDGISMRIFQDINKDDEASITLDGKKVGHLTYSRGIPIIRYNDQSFESL